jgi:WD40 repeat protein
VTTGNEKPIAKAHLGDLRDFRFIEDGKSLICYTASKGELETHKWNVATGEKVTSKVAAGDAPLALSVDGKWVCSQRVLNKVGEYVLRNTITGEEKPATKLSDTLLLFHKLSPDGRYLVARGLRDDTLRVLDLHSCREVVVWKDVVLWAAGDLPHTPVVSFSPDSKMIAISSRDGTIRLWNLPEAKKNEK